MGRGGGWELCSQFYLAVSQGRDPLIYEVACNVFLCVLHDIGISMDAADATQVECISGLMLCDKLSAS